MDQQSHYVGLDVSLETTSICVIDDAGAPIWRGKCSSDPDTITAIVRQDVLKASPSAENGGESYARSGQAPFRTLETARAR